MPCISDEQQEAGVQWSRMSERDRNEMNSGKCWG